MTRIAQEAVGAARTDELATRASKLGQYVHDVEARFGCGHRKADWDDGYGKCAICPLIAQAHENDDKDGRIEVLSREHGHMFTLLERLRVASGNYPSILPGSPYQVDEVIAQLAWLAALAIPDYALLKAADAAAEIIGKKIAFTLGQAFKSPVKLETTGLEEVIVQCVKKERGKRLRKDGGN